jgi:hypothetical protein
VIKFRKQRSNTMKNVAFQAQILTASFS